MIMALQSVSLFVSVAANGLLENQLKPTKKNHEQPRNVIPIAPGTLTKMFGSIMPP